jgi:hypothetical protein
MTTQNTPRTEDIKERDAWRRDRSDIPEATGFKGKASVDISKGSVVYVSSVSGVSVNMGLAKADTDATALSTIAVATGLVLTSKIGTFATFGFVRGLDTSSYSVGDTLYLSATTAGAFTSEKPVTPNAIVKIGTVIKSDATDGIVLVDIDIISNNASDLRRYFLTPTTQTVVAGTLTSGTVTDVQGWSDGSEVEIAEVAATPGFDVQYTIPNVKNFSEVLVAFYYVGSSTHDCQLQVYDDANTTWKEIISQSGAGLSHNTRYVYFPGSHADYIDSSGNVKIRFYHPQNGNSSHDLHIDYVSVIGESL